MPGSALSPRSLRLLGLAGILLIALNVRSAVAALSPLAGRIDADIPLDPTAIGLLGVVPPVAFALSGIIAPLAAQRWGLERSLLLAVVAMVVGHLVRAAAPDYVVLMLGTAVVLMGAGFGNILLPPAVKRYAPLALGAVTAAYATLMSISTALPPAIGVPIADAADWRLALGLWAVVAVLAAAPWLVLALRPPRPPAPTDPPTGEIDLAAVIEEPDTGRFRDLLRSRVTWGIAIAFTASSMTAYSVFAILPLVLQDVAGLSEAAAGAALAVFAIVGLPLSLVAPVLTGRLRRPTPLIVMGAACGAAGFTGMLLLPTAAPLLWVALMGAGQVLFPVCLALISQRSASPATATTLSGFVQAVGYSLAAAIPLALGVINTVTGSWAPALIVLASVALLSLTSIPFLRSGETVDAELARRAR